MKWLIAKAWQKNKSELTKFINHFNQKYVKNIKKI